MRGGGGQHGWGVAGWVGFVGWWLDFGDRVGAVGFASRVARGHRESRSSLSLPGLVTALRPSKTWGVLPTELPSSRSLVRVGVREPRHSTVGDGSVVTLDELQQLVSIRVVRLTPPADPLADRSDQAV